MKHIKSIFYFSLFALILISCDKDENRVTIKDGTTPPVLTSSSTTDLVLSPAQAGYASLQFQWTNPNYQFSNGVNTQDVSYILEIDTTGSNFSNPKRISMGFTNSVTTSFKVKELNSILSPMELKDYTPHNFEFRIKATLASSSVPVYSNVVKIKITTYLDTVYPVPDNLYIVGDATPSEWQNDASKPDASQTFKKVNSYLFQIDALKLTGGKYFLFLPKAGSWDHKYAFAGAKDSNNGSGDVFTYDGSNDIKAPATTGTYKIIVNFKTAKYSIQ